MFLLPIGSSKLLMKTLFLVLLFLLPAFAAFSQEARKIDEFENIPCDEYLGTIDNALETASKEPKSTLYFLFYEGKVLDYNRRTKETEFMFPVIGEIDAKIRATRGLVIRRKFPAGHFRFMKAGIREKATVEIWLVPAGAKEPTATPTLTKMKHRKGKAQVFCANCCNA
jgi:hypothetical protein